MFGNNSLIAVIAFALGLILKTLLDFKIAPWCVRLLHRLPVRNVFRDKPIPLAGTWEQQWQTSSENFKDETDRHSHPVILQLGKYCYAEFHAKGVTYGLFGRIQGHYFCGDWYDKTDPHGYFGTFQLRIIDSNTMQGAYLGHSKQDANVKAGNWSWQKHAT